MARRAVEGDEAALDLFLMQQRVSNVTARRIDSPREPQRRQSVATSGRSFVAFFVGTPSGIELSLLS